MRAYLKFRRFSSWYSRAAPLSAWPQRNSCGRYQISDLFPGLMGDLEKFINDVSVFDVDLLVKMALLHHQFERSSFLRWQRPLGPHYQRAVFSQRKSSRHPSVVPEPRDCAHEVGLLHLDTLHADRSGADCRGRHHDNPGRSRTCCWTTNIAFARDVNFTARTSSITRSRSLTPRLHSFRTI